MSKTFRVTPKRTKIENGVRELQDVYARLYAFDYRKAFCSGNDFDFETLD